VLWSQKSAVVGVQSAEWLTWTGGPISGPSAAGREGTTTDFPGRPRRGARRTRDGGLVWEGDLSLPQ
jgi:hypothetical protein